MDTKNNKHTKEIDFKNEGESQFEKDKKIISEMSGAFKCVICGERADIWYEYGYEYGDHINGEPEDGHFPVPPEQTDDDEVY